MTSVVQETPGFEVAGEASSGEESLVAAAELLPDLVLIDVNLPGIDGLEATRRLRGHDCPPAVLLLSTYNEDLGEQFVAEFGAMAYVTESAFGPEVLEASGLLRSADLGRLAQRSAARRAPPSRCVQTRATSMPAAVVAVGR
jgi:DNA-binding NarL/FixJ family response regulator